ncbi:J domain-containing protein [Bacillus sp. ISL-57]|uniref:J domain-containing protein n=1 Tax=Bacillus sp. ISL-57 TaxID=2819135 RepID=UPI001BEAECEE|nr:J domain-containing protein [Bacillus sp. ISL-57]MBT2717535.1 J domain-containing protein [Bacillus sp. ISL-57]
MLDNKTSLKGIKALIFSVFACLLFWKYYFQKDSYEKDVKIYETMLFHRFTFSNIVLITSMITLAKYYFFESMVDPRPLIFLGILIFFIHWIIQFKHGAPYWMREDAKRSKERFQAYEEYVKTLPRTSFDDFIDNLFTSFFGEGKKSNQEWSNREYEKQQNNQGKNEIETILAKFDLPPDTTDYTIIKRQFKKLAKKYHPDMPNGNEQVFKKLIVDFEILNNYFNFKKDA